MLLDPLGVLALAAELLEDLGLRVLFRYPSSQGVGEKNTGAEIVRKGSACGFEQRCNLKVRDDERCRHNFETEHATEGDANE